MHPGASLQYSIVLLRKQYLGCPRGQRHHFAHVLRCSNCSSWHQRDELGWLCLETWDNNAFQDSSFFPSSVLLLMVVFLFVLPVLVLDGYGTNWDRYGYQDFNRWYKWKTSRWKKSQSTFQLVVGSQNPSILHLGLAIFSVCEDYQLFFDSLKWCILHISYSLSDIH